MHNFKELKVWKESMVLAKAIYLTTKVFPDDEKFGLTSQLRRCSVSIPINFLNISIGSSYELETQILLANDFGYLTEEKSKEMLEKIISVQRMLNGLRNKLP